MIYLALPCKLCNSCFKQSCSAVYQCFGNACTSIGDACASVSKLWQPITSGPLGFYVMGTWFLMVLVIGGSGMTLIEPSCKNAQTFCFINMGFGAVHVVMARYTQWAIVKELTKRAEAAGQELSTFTVGAEVASAAAKVGLEDIPFCLYVFVHIGAIAYNIYGMSDYYKCSGVWAAAAVLIVYGMGVGNYFLCWYFCKACCGRGGQKKGSGSQPQPMVVGGV